MGIRIRCLSNEDREEFFGTYIGVYSSREEAEAFYSRFLDNGWISGAWKNGKLIGVCAWFPREAVKNGLAEIIRFGLMWRNAERGLAESLLIMPLSR